MLRCINRKHRPASISSRKKVNACRFPAKAGWAKAGWSGRRRARHRRDPEPRPESWHGCPGKFLLHTTGRLPVVHTTYLPVAGLVPWAFSPRTRSVGTHVSPSACTDRQEGVDGRAKPGQGGIQGCADNRYAQPASVPRTALRKRGEGGSGGSGPSSASLSPPFPHAGILSLCQTQCEGCGWRMWS